MARRKVRTMQLSLQVVLLLAAAAATDENAKNATSVAGNTSSESNSDFPNIDHVAEELSAKYNSWDAIGIGVVLVETLIGGVFFLGAPRSPDLNYWQFMITTPASAFHIIAQFFPFAAYFMRCKTEDGKWVDCENGLWWPVHWAYFAVLFSALPELGGAQGQDRAKIPVLGCMGTFMARVFLFTISALAVSDQFLDSMAAVIALQCGWRLAPLMAALVPIGMLAQALTAQCFGAAGMVAIAGFTPEGSLLEGERIKRDAEAMNPGNADAVNFVMQVPHIQKIMRMNENYVMAQGLSKLITENLPQAYLSIMFAQEVKPNKIVYLSAAMSIALAAKAFVTAVVHLCQSPTVGRPLE